MLFLKVTEDFSRWVLNLSCRQWSLSVLLWLDLTESTHWVASKQSLRLLSLSFFFLYDIGNVWFRQLRWVRERKLLVFFVAHSVYNILSNSLQTLVLLFELTYSHFFAIETLSYIKDDLLLSLLIRAQAFNLCCQFIDLHKQASTKKKIAKIKLLLQRLCFSYFNL